ncbi:MAG: hypothetical protein R3Y65_00250 [Bacillota bacterium]
MASSAQSSALTALANEALENGTSIFSSGYKSIGSTSEASADQSTEITVSLADNSYDYLSDYVSQLESAAADAAAAIQEQYEIAEAQAYETKNNAISLANQEYLESINPYGTTSESLASYGFDSSGGYSVSNDQANYANYINSQNVANSAYQDAVTDLEIASINAQVESNAYYADLSSDLLSGMEQVYSQIIAQAEEDDSQIDEQYQENLLSALEFVETLYDVMPTRISLDNTDLQDYIEKVYGVTGSDYEFLVNSVVNLLGEYGYVDNYFWG